MKRKKDQVHALLLDGETLPAARMEDLVSLHHRLFESKWGKKRRQVHEFLAALCSEGLPFGKDLLAGLKAISTFKPSDTEIELWRAQNGV